MNSSEQDLFDQLANESLTACLSGLRQVCSDVWDTGSGYLVPYFTGHGLQHSTRLVSHLASLSSEPVTGRPLLNSHELFVSLAAAYLHDIGMQLDPRKRTSVIALAELRGAKFETVFSGGESGPLSTDQELDIRRNHAYLSAAWLDTLRGEPLDSVGSQVSAIPAEYLADIETVCEFHSRLDLVLCPRGFHVVPDCRLRLCAALVRMADEMDTDRRRIRANATAFLAMPASNAVHWHLASRTFSSLRGHELTLVVALSPNDYRRFSSLVKEALIDGFELKNARAMEVLEDASIRVRVTRASRCVADEHHEDLPPDVRRHLEALGRERAGDDLKEMEAEQGNVRTHLKETQGTRSVSQRVAGRLTKQASAAEKDDKLDTAIALYREAIQLGDTAFGTLRSYSRLIADSAEDLDVDPVFARREQSPELAAAYAYALARRGDKRALAVAKKTYSAAADSVHALNLLSEAYRILDASGLDVRAAKRAFELEPSVIASYNLGLAHGGAGHLKKAAACIDTYLQAEPTDGEALVVRGLLAMDAKDPCAADYFARALQVDVPAEQLLGMGSALERDGQYGLALDAADKLVGIDPNNAHFRIQRARVLRYLRDFTRALKDLHTALDLGAQSTDVHTALGYCYIDMNRPEDAERHFRLALAAGGWNPLACGPACGLARILLECGDYGAALANLQLQTEEDEVCRTCSALYYVRSCAHAGLHHPILARRDFERHLDLSTSDDPRGNLGDFYLAVLHDPHMALRYYRQVADSEKDPETQATAYAGMSSCYESQERYAEAARVAGVAAGLAPANARILRQAGRAHFLNGELGPAASFFSSAAELEPNATNLLHVAFAAVCNLDGVTAFEYATSAEVCADGLEVRLVALWYQAVALSLMAEDASEKLAALSLIRSSERGCLLPEWDVTFVYEYLHQSNVEKEIVQQLIHVADELRSSP